MVSARSFCYVATNIMYKKGQHIHKYLCQHIGIYSASIYSLTPISWDASMNNLITGTETQIKNQKEVSGAISIKDPSVMTGT